MSFQEEYQQVLGISLDAETFTHPVSAYQVLAEQGNEETERLLNLVHTTESMQRAKEALAHLSQGAGDDFEYAEDTSSDDQGAGPSTHAAGPLPSWLTATASFPAFQDTLVSQFQAADRELLNASANARGVYQAQVASLQLHKLHYVHT